MAYCVKCGVELDKHLSSCPLCSTPVYYPEEAEEGFHKRYPDRIQKSQPRHVNLVPSKAFVYLMTFILIIPTIVCLMIDIRGSQTITWSFYPSASLLLIWILMAYPALMKRYSFMKVLTIDIYAIVAFIISLDLYSGDFLSWSIYPVSSMLLIWVYFLLAFLFRHRNPAFMVIIGYISTVLYLYLIEQATKTVWFLDLALPEITLIFILTVLVLVLSRLKFFKKIALVGLLFFAISLLCVGTELILNLFLQNSLSLFWSLIVSGVCIPVAIFLVFVESNEEFRVYLQKKFHF